MHRLRRKLSEPAIAGHSPAAPLCIQRMTSIGDSGFARIIANVCHATHWRGKQNLRRKALETSILPYYLAFRDRN
jgi:hypothetical protein